MSFRLVSFLCWIVAWESLLHAQNDDFPIVAEDLEVRLFARDPLVRNPCAMAFDARGRLFVGMGPQYRKPKPDTPGDSVYELIDTDLDGVADDRKEFARGLNNIQGLCWVGDVLWIANAPDLTLVKDTDQDGVGDSYTKLYTDLGNIEHGLHGLNRGPDGWVYMSKGNSKGLNQAPERVAPKAFRELWGMEAPVGTPDFPASKKYTATSYQNTFHHPSDDWGLNGGILKCRPDGSDLEIVSRGFRNPWDITFDHQFNWLGTDNDQNLGDKIFSPFFSANFGWGHPWSYDWKGDDHLPSAPSSGPLFEGSGTGVIFCDVEGYPGHYQGVYLINDWLRREVYIYRPQWKGAWMRPESEKLLTLAKAGTGRTMPSSAGRSFDPVDIEIGPEGGIYISSWGRQYGVEWQNGQMVNEGRIYLMWPKGYPLKAPKRQEKAKPWDQWSLNELLSCFDQPLPALRADAQDELVGRGIRHWDALVQAMDQVEAESAQETWILWTLGRIGENHPKGNAFFADQWQKGINRRLQTLRIVAHQARVNQASELPPFVGSGLMEEEARLRHASVLAIHQASDVNWKSLLLELIGSESDRIVFYSAWQAMRDLFSPSERIQLLEHEQAPLRRAALLSLLEDDLLEESMIKPLVGDPDPMTSFLAQKRLSGRATPVIKGAALTRQETVAPKETAKLFSSVMEHLSSESGLAYEVGILNEHSEAYIDRAYQLVEIPAHLEGLPFIRSANADAESQVKGGMSFELLFPSRVYIADDTRAPQPPGWLTDHFDGTDQFLSTEDARHRIYQADFPAGLVRLGSNQSSPRVSKSSYIVILEPQFLQPQSSTTSIQKVLDVLDQGNPQRGRALFHDARAANCVACHALENRGQVLAPDLMDIFSRSKPEVLIQSILDPSAVITEGFASQAIETTDGETYSGLVVSESGRDILIADATGQTRRILKSQIELREGSELSAMPGGFGDILSPTQVADLLAYLKTQTSAPSTAEEPGASTEAQIEVIDDWRLEPASDGWRLIKGEQELARFYHKHPEVHRPFWAHVKTPSGLQVTRPFPPVEGVDATDHASMHPGLSMGFAILNGVNFWHNREGRVVHLGYDAMKTQGLVLTLNLQQAYVDADGSQLCKETLEYRIVPNTDGYLISQESMFSADKPFYFGVKEEMGLTMRVATPLVVRSGLGGRILNGQGGENEKGTWGKVDQWWDYSGTIQGQWVGMQLMTGPGNPDTWAHSRDYGVLVANPFPLDIKANRSKRVDVPPGETFTLRFGVQIHQHLDAQGFDPAQSYRRYLSIVSQP